MTAITFLSVPTASTAHIKPSARSRLDLAIRDLAGWPDQDRNFFIAAFTTRKSGAQLAREMGMTPSAYQLRRRDILRRFIRAAAIQPSA